MNHMIFKIIIGLMLAVQSMASSVKIQSVKGEVNVRRGLEEKWSPASAGMNLEGMDTILSAEASEVVLVLEDGTRFTMGSYAILDISDLKRITERQLFLYLMSQKIGQLDIPESTKTIHITNVSVVRGTKKQADKPAPVSDQIQNWKKEVNGAKALIKATLYTNAIMKLYKIVQRYPVIEDQGEIHFYLGRSFEAINENGRAYEVYQKAMNQISISEGNPEIIERKMQIESALNRLKNSL
jgi:tetratricopeptide (TPR) repeat protein